MTARVARETSRVSELRHFPSHGTKYWSFEGQWTSWPSPSPLSWDHLWKCCALWQHFGKLSSYTDVLFIF